MELDNRCERCNKVSQNLQKFSCNHLLCTSCICHMVYCSHLKSLCSHENISLVCKCKHGSIYLSLAKIQEFLSLCTDKCADCQNLLVKLYCTICSLWFCEKCSEIHNSNHPNHLLTENHTELFNCANHPDKTSEYYCWYCREHSCELCIIKGEKHYAHDYQKIKPFADNVHLEFQRQYYTMGSLSKQLAITDKISDQFKSNMASAIEKTNGKIDALIATLKEAKEVFGNNMEQINEKGGMMINIIQMLYSKHYLSADKNVEDTDTDFKHHFTELAVKTDLGDTIDKFHKSIVPLDNYLSSKIYPVEAYWTNASFFQNVERCHPIPLIQLQDGRLASGADSGEISIWEVNEDDVKKTKSFNAHDHGRRIFTLIQLKDERLASGSADNTIKIWNIKDMQNPVILTGHTNSITSLVQLQDKKIKIASGSWDCSIKIWEEDESGWENTMTLSGHNDKINCMLQMKDGRLVSGANDKTMRIWEIKEREFSNNLTYAEEYITFSLFNLKDGRVISSSSDHKIRIWDITYVMVNTHTYGLDNFYFTSLTQLEDGTLLSLGSDGAIRFWELSETKLRNSHCLVENMRRYYSVILLQDRRLVSTSEDLTMKIWNSNQITK